MNPLDNLTHSLNQTPSDNMPLSMIKFSRQLLSFRFSNLNFVWSYPISKFYRRLTIFLSLYPKLLLNIGTRKNALHTIYRRFWCSILQNAVLWRVLVKVIMNPRPIWRLLESAIEVFHRNFTIYVHLTSLDDNGSFCCRKFGIRKESCANKNANAMFPLYYQMSTASHTCLYGLLHRNTT